VALLPVHSLRAVEPVSVTANPLKSVSTFMYQLQGLEDPASLEKLAKSPYDLLVVEPTLTLNDQNTFDAKAMVAALKAGKPGRLVIAYVDIGEAERFRTYWDKSWKPPTKKAPGSPAFLLAPDPDGWKDDVSIAFWDPQWQALWLGDQGLLKKIIEAGFDGVYLDWVEAYDEKRVAAQARKQGVDPVRAMVDFIGAIRAQVRRARSDAVVIAQNAPDLIDADPRYAHVIDGVGFEDTWFHGQADAGWDSPKGGDIPNHSTADDSTAGRLKQYQKFLRAGLPVFTIDYCLKPENAARVYQEATKAGFIPLVTRVSLERMTTTPPDFGKTPSSKLQAPEKLQEPTSKFPSAQPQTQ
jgi:cysteinyl-tRNA synthetase